jgi:hypothetical protein
MTRSYSHGSFAGLIGVSRRDITPPAGIYSRMWGAAKHDVALGVHRPLTLSLMTLQRGDEPPLVLISSDLGWWRTKSDEEFMRQGLLDALSLPVANVMFNLGHTHAGPSLSMDDAEQTGGALIKPYLQSLRETLISSTREALKNRKPATLDWNYGKCALATNRDLPDPAKPRSVVGFNPENPADDTLLVGRVSDSGGKILATVVNYACHPVTLAWQNNLISPDFVGAMREVVEAQTESAPCFFLQGASGELAPREQYTGETRVADNNGRQLGFAALAALAGMLPARTRLDFAGVVESGAPLATWQLAEQKSSTVLDARVHELKLPLKQLPSLSELDAALAACTDRVTGERLRRKRAVRKGLGEGNVATVPVWAWRVGDAFIVGQCNEAYSYFQTELRRQFAAHPVLVMNLVNGSCGYLPPKNFFDRDMYTVWQTPFAAGCLEATVEGAASAIAALGGSNKKGA